MQRQENGLTQKKKSGGRCEAIDSKLSNARTNSFCLAFSRLNTTDGCQKNWNPVGFNKYVNAN